MEVVIKAFVLLKFSAEKSLKKVKSEGFNVFWLEYVIKKTFLKFFYTLLKTDAVLSHLSESILDKFEGSHC